MLCLDNNLREKELLFDGTFPEIFTGCYCGTFVSDWLMLLQVENDGLLL